MKKRPDSTTTLPITSQGDSPTGGTALRMNNGLFYKDGEWERKRDAILRRPMP